eukprot:6486111-Alexandrium_andersonii.AAC.1
MGFVDQGLQGAIAATVLDTTGRDHSRQLLWAGADQPPPNADRPPPPTPHAEPRPRRANTG